MVIVVIRKIYELVSLFTQCSKTDKTCCELVFPTVVEITFRSSDVGVIHSYQKSPELAYNIVPIAL